MTTEKPNKKKGNPILRLVRFTLWLLLALVFIVFILISSFNAYLKSSEKKIIENAAFLNHGSISFEEAYISIFEDFPNTTIVVKNLSVLDSMYAKHLQPTLSVDELQANISLKEWRSKDVEIQSFVLKSGTFNLFTNADGYNNLKSILAKKDKRKEGNAINNNEESKIKINSKNIKLQLIDFDINIIDAQKSSKIIGKANTISAELHLDEETISCDVDLDIKMSELTFKEKDGSYIKGAHIRGSLNALVLDDKVSIEPFDLDINDQQFLFAGQIAMDKSLPTILNLENRNTQLDQVLTLLPHKISKVIQPYEIEGGFYSKTQIYLKKGRPAKVDVRFELPDNDLVIQGVPFQKAKLSGRFMNRKLFGYQLGPVEKANIRLELSNLKTQHQSFVLEADDILISSNPITKARIKSNIIVSGPAVGISDWYKNEQFFFEDGNFILKADIHGPLNDVNQLILESTADLKLKDLAVLYQPADVVIPVHSLELIKREGDANFSILSTTLSKKYDYRMDGALKNLAALLVNFANESASSNVNLKAERLSWEDFVGVFSQGKSTKKKILKNERATKRSMKETIRGIYNKVKPSVSISIDTFEYFNLIDFYNVSTGIHFENENVLVLDQTNIDLEQGNISLKSRLDISHPHETIFEIELHATNINLDKILPTFDFFNIKILENLSELPDDFNLDINIAGVIDDVEGLLPNSAKGEIKFRSEHHDDILGVITFAPELGSSSSMVTQVDLQGSPHLFNDFFKNDKFFFQDTGGFHLQFEHFGDIASFKHILENTDLDLSIREGAVYYKDADIVFPLNDFDITLNQDTVDYKLYMNSSFLNRELYVVGDLNNISELLYGNTGKSISTFMKVYSPIINIKHAVDIFETPIDSTKQVEEEEVDHKLKKLTRSMLNRFNPTIELNLDTLIVNEKIQLTGLSSGCYLKDSSFFILEQTDFKFGESQIGLNINLDMSQLDEEPFEAHIRTSELELGDVLYSFDYLGQEEMKNAELIDGQITLDMNISGSLIDLALDSKKTNAIIDFDLHNLELKGVGIIDRLAKKLRVYKFFHDIRFAPITNQISIIGNKIEIPQMEIQSTSINLFVEGHIDKSDKSNLWLSVPLDNVRKMRDDILREKRGYAATKMKIFLEIKSGKRKTKTHFRLRKRKFYKQRGILKQYRADRKKYRAIRKKRKKEKTK